LSDFSQAFWRGWPTVTGVTCGLSRSYHPAAQVPSSKVNPQVAAPPADKLHHGGRLGFQDGFHHPLAGGIPHRPRDRVFVNVPADILRTLHERVLLSLTGCGKKPNSPFLLSVITPNPFVISDG
jgi:hypothetical protein